MQNSASHDAAVKRNVWRYGMLRELVEGKELEIINLFMNACPGAPFPDEVHVDFGATWQPSDYEHDADHRKVKKAVRIHGMWGCWICQFGCAEHVTLLIRDESKEMK